MTATTARPRARRGLLRVHAWVIVAAVLVTIASAWGMLQARSADYVATAQVSVGPEPTGGTALRPEMASERAIVASGSVAALAASTLDVDYSQVRHGLAVSIVLESSVLDISYTAATGSAAQRAARAFAQAYVDYRNDVAGTRIARVVTWPDSALRTGPSRSLVLGVALIAGLLLGLGAAWTWDRLSDRIRSPEELVERSGIPVLGQVPRWGRRGPVAPPGPARETFAYLSSRLGSLLGHRHVDLTVVVTSPRPGAGTTTIALNTARAIGAQGRTVVVVGADVHHPQLHEALRVPVAPGLVQVLRGETTLDSALRPTEWANVSVLPLGALEPDGEADLQPDMLDLVLDELRSSAVVVVDAPPVLAGATSLLLVDRADALLLVGDLRAGRRRDVEQTTDLIEQSRPAVAGWVANTPRRGASAHLDDPQPSTAPVADALDDGQSGSDRVAS